MVRGKVRFALPQMRRREMPDLSISAHAFQSHEQRQDYKRKLDECLYNHPSSSEHSAEQKWNILKDCIVSAAKAVAGCRERKQPDWFTEAADTLQPLLRAKHQAHNRFLSTNSIADKRVFRRHQRIVKNAVDAAKQGCICNIAREAEKAKKDSRRRWISTRQLQMTYAGRKPTRPTALKKKNGMMMNSQKK